MRAATVSDRIAPEVGLATIEPGLNCPVASSPRRGARKLLGDADRRLKREMGKSLHGSVAWLFSGNEESILRVPGHLGPEAGVVGVPRGPISSLGASPRSAARRLLGAIDRRIRRDIIMSLRGRGPWMLLRRPGSLTFVPRHLRQRSSGGRRQGRASTLRCGRPSPQQSRSSGMGDGGGGSGSGGAGSSAGDSSDGGSGDAGKPALDRQRTIEARACLGGRRAF